ncbi:MAG: phosphatase PAP2 family protein [Flavobacteriaceae bacterium]|nr:phosphatase PAP2 family protein [Flavobacteriaceae bacterium]
MFSFSLQTTKLVLSFWDELIKTDKGLLVKLNAFGTESWDSFWLAVTNQFYWVPLFLLLFVLLIRTFGWKKGLILIVFAALLVTFSDQLVNLIKNSVQRLRPNNDPEINEIIRALKHPRGYSFVSAHSTTSFAVTTFMILLLRYNFRYIKLLLIWPFLFAYSRIYCGVHFPIDIILGMFLGIIIGFVFYRLSLTFFVKRSF